MKKRMNERLGVRLLLSLVFFLGSATAFGQPPGNVDIDNSAPPVVIDSIDDIGDVNVNAGKLLIIRTGAAAGIHYYSPSATDTVDNEDVLNGPNSVGRWLRIGTGGGGAGSSDSVMYFDTVAAMFAETEVVNGQEAATARYSTSHAVGDGSGNTYVYDADSTATIDGGFVLPGVGGELKFKQQWRTLSSQTNSTTVVIASAASSTDDDYNGEGVTFQLPEVTGTSQSGSGTSFVLAADDVATDDYYNQRDIVVIWAAVSGTAQTGSTTTMTLEAGASATDDFYNGRELWITDGEAKDVRRTITDYDGTTKVATVSTAFTTAPDNTSVYSIREAKQRYTVEDYVGSTKTVTLSDSLTYLSDSTTTYSLTRFMIGSAITDYVGSTRTATLSPALPCVLPSGTVYSVGTKIRDVSIDFSTSNKTWNCTNHGFVTNDRVYILTDGQLPNEMFHEWYSVLNETADTFELRRSGVVTAHTVSSNGTGRLRAYMPIRGLEHEGETGVGRWIAKDASTAKAKQFGCIGNEADDTIPLLAMMEAVIANDNCYRVEISNDYYATKQPIDTYNKHGLIFEVGGPTFYTADLDRSTIPRGSAALVWDGPAYGNVLSLLSGFTSFPHLAIHGNTSSSDSNQAKYGAVVRRIANVGNGKYTFGRVSFKDCNIGMEWGDTSNCDESQFEFLEFQDCQVGLQLIDEQSIGFYIDLLRLFYTDVGIRVESFTTSTGGGGDIHVGDVFVAGQHVKICDIKSTNGTAQNNGDFIFNHIKIDGNCRTIQFVDTNDISSQGKSLRFNNIRIDSNVTKSLDAEPMFDASGGTLLTVSNAYGLAGNVLKLTGSATQRQKPSAYFHRCSFAMTQSDVEALSWLTTTSQINGYIIKGCYTFNDGFDIPTISNGTFASAYDPSARDLGSDASLSADIDFDSGTSDLKTVTVQGESEVSFTATRQKVYKFLAKGKANFALVTNGTSDFVDSNYSLAASTFTVFAEVRHNGTAAFAIDWRNAGNLEGAVLYSNTAGRQLNFAGAGFVPQTSTDTLPLDQWASVALRYDGTKFTSFINGYEVDSLTQAYIPNTSGTSLKIGKSSSGNFFSGAIRNVNVYTSALTDAQILQLHQQQSVGSPVLQYVMDDNSSTIVDTGSAGSDGTLTGGTWEATDLIWPGNIIWKAGTGPTWSSTRGWQFFYDGTDFIEF